MTYLIAFTCYGRHLHGDQSGSVDRKHRLFGLPILERDPARAETERERMRHLAYHLDLARREAVLQALHEVCAQRGWTLLAAHVRTTHVHTVVEAGTSPERVMIDFKTYASRRLDRLRPDEPGQKRWTRHGSTRWLWKPKHVSAAVEYVLAEQGEPMSVYDAQCDPKKPLETEPRP